MKRKLSPDYVAYRTRSKHPKLVEKLDFIRKRRIHWVSATKTRNYMIGDTLIDWLERKSKNLISKDSSPRFQSRKKSEVNSFSTFLMNKGCEFENSLVSYINAHKIPVIKVSDIITPESLKLTETLMKLGTPVIHSAPVANTSDHTRGIIDLLVRSDYLRKIVDDCPLTEDEEKIAAPNLKANYHYVVIDIKFSTLPLRSDGRHILNSGCYPAYKAQTLIYTRAVGQIQGYVSRYAYIMGRRWNNVSKNVKSSSDSCDSRIGVIDFKGVDRDFEKKTDDAVGWYRSVISEGDNWRIHPPTRIELYPNMCQDSGKWQSLKSDIAREIGEITSIWNCGVKHRNNAYEMGITSWRDTRCNSTTLKIGGKIGHTIDKILDINRQNSVKIAPQKIDSVLYDWRNETRYEEAFVDFETLTDVFSPTDSMPKQPDSSIIFMIGIYFRKPDRNWEFKTFICEEASKTEELRIMCDFDSFVKSLGSPRLWFWHAETKFWNQAKARHISSSPSKVLTFENYNWFDLCKFFREVPIVVKGCFSFRLKEVAQSMRENGLISTNLTSECNSGTNAMVKAWNAYSSENVDKCIIQDIASYNKFDCIVMKDILEYLREKH